MKAKIINFKTVSPFFEQERYDKKCLTFREYDGHDSRFKALSQWRPEHVWYIRITNPATGESFIRRISNYAYLWWYDQSQRRLNSHEHWRVIEWFPTFAGLVPEGLKPVSTPDKREG